MAGNFEHYRKKTNYRSSKFREPRRRIKIEIKHIKNNDSETTENQTHTQKILKSATAKREHYLEVKKKKKSNITTACLSEHIQVGINDITF